MIFKSYLLENNIETLNSYNIFLFYGENYGLKQDLKVQIRKFYKSSEKINLIQEEIINNKNLLTNEIFNKSLFNDTKIYFIEQANDKILTFLQEIEAIISKEKIFIFAEVLEKKSKLRSYFEKSKIYGVCPCYEDNIITIKSIISKKLHGYTGLTPEVVNFIIESAGLQRNRVNNEIEKIKACFANKRIDYSKIELLLNIKTNDDFNKLRDEAINGNKNKTNSLLNDTSFNNEENFHYLSSINQRMIKLKKIDEQKKGNGNIEQIISNIKPPIFWKDKPIISQQAKKWGSKKIKLALNKIYDTELKIKSNSDIRNDLLVKNLIVDLCNTANDVSIN